VFKKLDIRRERHTNAYSFLEYTRNDNEITANSMSRVLKG